jgi:hypothetical protein
MFTPAQGLSVEGCRTLAEVGAETPRAGAKTTPAALTEDVKTRGNMGAVKNLESISTNNGKARRVVVGSARDSDCEELVL